MVQNPNMKDTSPFRQLAVPEYLRMFQDLLSPTAEVSWFEKVLIEGTYELVVLGHYEGDQLKGMENASRVAYLQNPTGWSFYIIRQTFWLQSFTQ
jgi:hypothetical protein